MEQHELEDKCFALAEECIATFERVHSRSYGKFLQLKFDLKGHCAGKAYQLTHVIRLNVDLLNRYQDEFIRDTVPHECAHLFVQVLFPHASAHGYRWRQMMHSLGYEPERTHKYVTKSARKSRKFVWTCGCRDHDFGVKRHCTATKGWTKHHCRSCRNLLTYTGRSVVK